MMHSCFVLKYKINNTNLICVTAVPSAFHSTIVEYDYEEPIDKTFRRRPFQT